MRSASSPSAVSMMIGMAAFSARSLRHKVSPSSPGSIRSSSSRLKLPAESASRISAPLRAVVTRKPRPVR